MIVICAAPFITRMSTRRLAPGPACWQLLTRAWLAASASVSTTSAGSSTAGISSAGVIAAVGSRVASVAARRCRTSTRSRGRSPVGDSAVSDVDGHAGPRHRRREPPRRRRVGLRRREQSRQHAVVHDGVDLDPLDLGRVLPAGIAVSEDGRGLSGVDRGRSLPQQGHEDQDRRTEQERVGALEKSVIRGSPPPRASVARRRRSPARRPRRPRRSRSRTPTRPPP